MDINIFIVILGLITGLSTLIGSMLIFLRKKDINIVVILGISIGVLFSLAFFELFHEAFEIIDNHFLSLLNILIFGTVGYFATFLLDKLIHHKKELKHVGVLTTIGINMHRIPEGIILAITTYADIRLGILFAVAISLHHIPEGAIISMPIYYSTKSKFKALLYALISSFSSVIGVVIALLFLKNIESFYILSILYSISIGMFIYIIFNELLDLALSYKKYKLLLICILMSIVFMNLIHILFH